MVLLIYKTMTGLLSPPPPCRQVSIPPHHHVTVRQCVSRAQVRDSPQSSTTVHPRYSPLALATVLTLHSLHHWAPLPQSPSLRAWRARPAQCLPLPLHWVGHCLEPSNTTNKFILGQTADS